MPAGTRSRGRRGDARPAGSSAVVPPGHPEGARVSVHRGEGCTVPCAGQRGSGARAIASAPRAAPCTTTPRAPGAFGAGAGRRSRHGRRARASGACRNRSGVHTKPCSRPAQPPRTLTGVRAVTRSGRRAPALHVGRASVPRGRGRVRPPAARALRVQAAAALAARAGPGGRGTRVRGPGDRGRRRGRGGRGLTPMPPHSKSGPVRVDSARDCAGAPRPVTGPPLGMPNSGRTRCPT